MSLISPETFHRELLLLALLTPCLFMLLLGTRRTLPYGRLLAPWAAIPALFAASLLPSEAKLEIGGLLPGAQLGIDATGRLFLFFSALLWWLGGWYTRGWFNHCAGQTRFVGFYLATMTANVGLILAQDLLTFYLFFTLMNFTAYGLVVHRGTLPAYSAGRIYIIFLLLGEACLFTAVAVAATEAETLTWVGLHESRIGAFGLSLFLIGFGIKLGMLGLHAWLPPVYSEAPIPASALLSGAVIKASLLGWIRVLPLGETGLEAGGQLLIYLGLGAAFYGSLMGLTQTYPKTVLAYSSISQMGLMTLLVGMGLHIPEAAPTVMLSIMLFTLHHALVKTALFLGVGIIGVAETVPKYFAWAGLLWLALALAGAPGTSGALAKFGLTQSMALAGLSEQLGLILSIASVATTLLMARFLYLLHGYYQTEVATPQMSMLWLPWTMLWLTLSVVPWQWLDMQGIETETLAPRQLWATLWPVALGSFIAGLTLYRTSPSERTGPPLPTPRQREAKPQPPRVWGNPPWLLHLEQALHHWSVVGRALVLLAILLIIVLMVR